MEEINIETLRNEINELYQNIKENISSSNNDNIDQSTLSPIQILKEIKDYLNKNNLNLIELENNIKKLEKDLKYHIKNEFMLKIQRDSLDSKIRGFMEMEEEFEELKEKVRYEGGKFMNNDRKDNEIKILRRENSNIKKEVMKMEIKIKKFEKKEIDDKQIIDELKLKITNSDKKIEEMEKEIEILKNKKDLNINNNINMNNNYYHLKIPDKNSLSKINKMKLKRDLTDYQFPISQANFESVKSNNQSRTIKIIDNNHNNSNKYIIHTFNKINNYSNKNNIVSNRNIKAKEEPKYKNNSSSVRTDNNKKFDLIGKFLTNDANKYISNANKRKLSRINSNTKCGLYNMPSTNSNLNIRTIKMEEKNFREYSGVNKIFQEL